jgi:hypothetical protein
MKRASNSVHNFYALPFSGHIVPELQKEIPETLVA